jgi:broad specificity phosphatase PhoE
MRYLEIRRHTMRVIPGQHLSQAGVDLARRIGETMGRFDHVGTSTIPRAFETAIAMGYAVNAEYPELALMGAEVEDEVAWDAGFAAFAEAVRKGGATARYAAGQAAFWRSVAEKLPENGATLMITHGGIIEAGAAACLPEGDHTAWGQYCSYCEGVRLRFADGRFNDIEILRVDGEQP